MENIRFISAQSVIAKLYSDLNLQMEIRVADVMEWIGDAIEYIGVDMQYLDKVIEGTVHNHRYFLPCDLVTIKQVLLNNTVIHASNHTIISTLPSGPRASKVLYNTPLPTYTVQNNCLVLSVERGAKIVIYYKGLNLDEEGFPYIPSDIRYMDAVVAYIMYKIKNAEGFSGRISPQEVQYYKVEWEKSRIRAASELMMPTPEQMFGLGVQFQRLVQNISGADQMFRDYTSIERTR